ncbi:nitrophenyl compound nitroreductase subunit ArsF family protein [Sunxiuqinia sp. sy24]|uniref:nitrophenyl compound nitroreductase subunit ArsF family protein n=1 Tax=Sunxiuqinia sp. sy24 TaxID=3461495 RepID=UPI0040456586
MKQLALILLMTLGSGILSTNAQCCNPKMAELANKQTTASEQADQTDVKAYYFHATRRCATCQAVEKVTKEALKEYYGEQVKFQSINREKDSKNPLLEKYKVSGQTLLIVKGDQVENLTNTAFLNARTKPEKLKAKLKATIDSMN